MKSLTNCSALCKRASISNREQQHTKPSKSYLITEQKPKRKLQLSIRKIHHNIKYPQTISKTHFTTVHNPSHVVHVHYKIYEIAIDAFFSFLKETLNTEMYITVKQMFHNEISKAMEMYIQYKNKHNKSFSCYLHKHSSSIGKVLSQLNVNDVKSSYESTSKSKKKNLKLSYDFYSNIKKKNVNSNMKLTNVYNNKNNGGNVNSINNTNKKEQKQHSLYTLTKNKKMLHNKTQSNSKSKSHSKENKKQNNFVLNIKLFKKLNKDQNKDVIIYGESGYNNIAHTKQSTHTLDAYNSIANTTKQKVKPKAFNNTAVVPNINIKLSHNKNSNFTLFCINNHFNSSTINNINNTNSTTTNTNRHHIDKSHKKQNHLHYKQTHPNTNKQTVITYNSKDKMSPHLACKSYRERKSIQISNDNNEDVLLNVNEKQNSEQLREIKSNLDENLKVMFNFSYEGFLNKESESESRKSFEGSTTPMEDNNSTPSLNKTNVCRQLIYKRKYDY